MIMLEKIKYYTRMNRFRYESSYAEFNGIEFVKNGEYYVNNTYGQLHRYIYEYYNGSIPAGYDIHHIDHKQSNNNINNLECIPHAQHIGAHKKGKHKGKNNPMFNKHHTQETKNKMSQSKKGKQRSDFSGNKNPSYKPRNIQMYTDIKNGMGPKEFMRKYKSSQIYYYNTKKEMQDNVNILIKNIGAVIT